METNPKGFRTPPDSGWTAVASGDPQGVVVVDLESAEEAEGIVAWLRLKGQCPILAFWRAPAVDLLGYPVVGIVTQRTDALDEIADRYPGALRIALVEPGADAPGADFVIRRPFRRDLVLP